MKFRFCGDLDCPDWVLAEINILSKLTSIKMRLLCGQVINSILSSDIDYEKVAKITADAKFDVGDIKASIAALCFIIRSAAKCDVDSDTLSNELQQLGLPKEHSTPLCKLYGDNVSKFQEQLRKQSLRLSQMDSVEWRVDYILSSKVLKTVNQPSIEICLRVQNPDTGATKPVIFNMSADKFRVFLNELKQVDAIMDNLAS
ncbi:COMM domain-containing protein 4-like [Argonauta hians]